MAARARSGRRGAAVRAPERVLHLDTFSGIAGNMFLGALLDAGLSRRELVAGLEGLGVPHRLRVSKVRRGALAARYVEVLVPKAGGGHRRIGAEEEHGHHDHAHPGRRYAEIRRLLARAKLPAAVRDRAQAIFAALAEAEARVHDVPVERVHFHEVGAVDALVDVTGAALALELLGVQRVTAAPPALGHGQVETRHGRLPLPAPATLELLRGIPTVPAHVAWETVTPTGAAILRTVASEFRSLPAMTIERIGHGAGNDREGPVPNVLRAVLGTAGGLGRDRVALLEANLDDLPPEHFDHVMERLFEAGALDVALLHQQMKKNRPGFLLRVVVAPDRRLDAALALLNETTSLGVRVAEADRFVLPREQGVVETPYGRIRIKRSARPDGRLEVSAEYDDCRRAARRAGVPLRDVVRAAEAAGRGARGDR